MAEWVMDRPLRVFAAATAVVLALAWPTLRIDTGFSNSRWLPRSMECRTGMEILGPLRQYNAVIPLYAVVRAPEGQPILQARHLPALMRFADALERDTRVGEVLSPVTLRERASLYQYLLLYRDLDRTLSRYPEIGEFFLSHDRSAALFQIVPGNEVRLRETQQLAKDIARMAPGGSLRLEVGGEPVYYNDFLESMTWASPLIVSLVIAVTAGLLFLAFRSYLLPAKAVIMNLLSVGAGYGVVTAVFQFGWGIRLFGMAEPLGVVPITVPLLIFCLTFGLSMDYEVFLLTRIKEAYDRTGDNRAATAEGLAATGGLITSAALIMVVVFGAFAFIEMPIGKMMGLGLAVTVLVDATLIRVLMVPSLMRIAGRWNWVPGERRPEAARPAEAALP